MVIYLEGPDGSGKTTLADKIVDICEELNIDYVLAEPSLNTRPNSPNRIGKDELIHKFGCMLEDTETVYILDRGPLSDIVYRLFDEYEPVCSLEEILSLMYQYQYNLLLIYCSTPEAEKYMKERGDDNPIALEKHHKISYAYNLMMSLMKRTRIGGLNYIKYDFVQDKDSIKDKITWWLKENNN